MKKLAFVVAVMTAFATASTAGVPDFVVGHAKNYVKRVGVQDGNTWVPALEVKHGGTVTVIKLGEMGLDRNTVFYPDRAVAFVKDKLGVDVVALGNVGGFSLDPVTGNPDPDTAGGGGF